MKLLINRAVAHLIWPLAIIFLLVGCSDSSEKGAAIKEASESIEAAMDDSALEHAAKHLDPKYVCPMHPQIIKNSFGSCPICGMDLVEKLIDPQAGKYPVVEINSAVVQSMGVRTTAAVTDTLWKYIRTVGMVDYDETTVTHLHPRASGWMETLAFRAEGDPVEAGQKLGELYSEEILNAQVDFLLAIEQAGGERMIKARNRLRLLGVDDATIKRIEQRRQTQNRVPVYAPSSGIMTDLMAREGMYVTPEMEIFTIADLSRVWVWVDVFEHQLAWVKPGLSAEITVPAYPGRTWEGQLDYIYPELDPVTRTLRVRLVFDNPDGLLKANMFAEAVIYGGPKRGITVVPSSAVITTGKRSAVVLALGDGRFQPVDVVTGMQRSGRTEILSGLEPGDEVVISGQFLIDSESSLQASFLRMAEGG